MIFADFSSFFKYFSMARALVTPVRHDLIKKKRNFYLSKKEHNLDLLV